MHRFTFIFFNRTIVQQVAAQILIFSLTCSVFAESLKIDTNKIYNDAQKTGLAEKGKILDLQVEGQNIKEVDQALQNKEGEAKYKATELGTLPTLGETARQNVPENGKNKCDKDDCNVSQVLGTQAVNKREVKLEEYGFKKDKEKFPENNKAYLDKANQKIKEYSEKHNVITGTYKDCKATEDTFTYKEKAECDEYYDVRLSNCPISQVVEIDPKYTYECNKKRDEAFKTCHDEIVSIKCENQGECDSGGIVMSSIASDMKWEYSYPTLILGTIQDNLWPGSCTVYDRSTKFTVKNLSKVTEFKLLKVEFDDYMWIRIKNKNEKGEDQYHHVYAGPDGGSKIELNMAKNWLGGSYVSGVTNGIGVYGCERMTNWNFSVNIDLKPYLREGENEILMRVVVSGHGEGWMQISAKQHCCKNWEIKREQKCEYEETK